MFRFSASLFTFALLFSLLPIALSGPACAKKHWQAADCIQRCKSKWGYPGSMMGTNSWGVVMKKTEKQSEDAWNQALASACGVTSEKSTSTDGPVKADGAVPNVPSLTSTFVTPSSTVVVPSSSSIVLESSTSSEVRSITLNRALKGGIATQGPTTSSTTPAPTTTSTPPPAPTTSSAAPPPPPPPPPPPTSTSKPPARSTPPPSPPPPPPPAPKPEPQPAPAPPSGGSSSGASGGDIGTYLSAHNSFRAQHGASPLTWSDNLANKAQQWANNCKFEHSKGTLGAFGENLAAGTGSSYGIESAIKSWTDEVKDYNPNNPVPSHFTQVVWKGSSQVGCALALCDGIFDARFGKAKYFVCEYSAQGNIIGEFAQNVQV